MKKYVISLTVISTVMSVFLMSAPPSQAFSLSDFFRSGSVKGTQTTLPTTNQTFTDKFKSAVSSMMGVRISEDATPGQDSLPVRNGIVNTPIARIDALLKAGRLTQQQADAIKTQITTVKTKQLELKAAEDALATLLKAYKVNADLQPGTENNQDIPDTIKIKVSPTPRTNKENPIRKMPPIRIQDGQENR